MVLGTGAAESFSTAEIKLPCSTSDRRGAGGASRKLASVGGDFHLGNFLTRGGEFWMQLPSADAVSDQEIAEVSDSIVAVTRPKARREAQSRVPAESLTPEVDYNKAGPLQEECKAPRGLSSCWKKFRRDRVGLVFLIHCAGAKCNIAEPQQEAPDFG